MFSKYLIFLTSLVIFLQLSCSKDPVSTDDTGSPDVSIISPINNSEFKDGDQVNIIASASDEDGVKEVRFYIDDVLESTDTVEPWEYLWDTSNRSGECTVFARAYDIEAEMGESAKINVIITNELPNAVFTVSPASGDSTTIFQVDASASSDREDPIEVLQVRWDWEDDGSWDTNFSITKTASHNYNMVGSKTIRLEVLDTYGNSDTTSRQVTVTVDTGDPGVITDIDGNEYNTIKIGNQWWMVENLRVTHYNDGTEIPLLSNFSSWSTTRNGAYCYYDDNIANADDYGLLYNFHAVDDHRGLAPEGWHVPSSEEWKEMEMYLGMTQEQADLTLWRGTDEGGKLKEAGEVHWTSPNTGATNETGFTALPAGYRNVNLTFPQYNGYFSIGIFTSFWTSTGLSASNNVNATVRSLRNDNARIYYVGYPRVNGLSVRCVKD